MKTERSLFQYFAQGIITFILFFSFQSCSKLFEYSPYDANVDDDQLNTNAIQLQGVSNQYQSPSNFSFAVIADVHYHYSSLASIVKHINKDDEIDFIIVAGDISDQALLKEYEIYYSIMDELEKPYLTLIGNHDYKSNGGDIYKQMYGETNYDFCFQDSHFILFDDVFWESNNSPDFDWLESKLQDKDQYNHQFVIAHIPPFGDQFDTESEARYVALMEDYSVSLSIHGHVHFYVSSDYYNDGTNYLVVPWPKKPKYVKVSVNDKTVAHTLINI